MILVGSSQNHGGSDMYMADRLSPKQKISHEGQILAYNKQIQSQQYVQMNQSSRQSPNSSQQMHRQPMAGKNSINRTSPAQTAMIDTFAKQQHNNYVNGPHQLATQMMRQPQSNNPGYATALDEGEL